MCHCVRCLFVGEAPPTATAASAGRRHESPTPPNSQETQHTDSHPEERNGTHNSNRTPIKVSGYSMQMGAPFGAEWLQMVGCIGFSLVSEGHLCSPNSWLVSQTRFRRKPANDSDFDNGMFCDLVWSSAFRLCLLPYTYAPHISDLFGRRLERTSDGFGLKGKLEGTPPEGPACRTEATGRALQGELFDKVDPFKKLPKGRELCAEEAIRFCKVLAAGKTRL